MIQTSFSQALDLSSGEPVLVEIRRYTRDGKSISTIRVGGRKIASAAGPLHQLDNAAIATWIERQFQTELNTLRPRAKTQVAEDGRVSIHKDGDLTALVSQGDSVVVSTQASFDDLQAVLWALSFSLKPEKDTTRSALFILSHKRVERHEHQMRDETPGEV